MKKTYKKWLSLSLAGAMMLSTAIPASAADNQVAVSLNGETIASGAYADSNNRTQIPVSAAEKLGMTVTQTNKDVTFTKDGQSLTLTVGQAAGDTTVVENYAPLAYLAEYFGLGISWDGTTRTAALTAAQEQTVTKLPNLVYSELETLMAQQAAKYQTKDNVVPMLWQGLLEMDISVGDTTRTAKLYVPDGTPQGAMFVVMNVPEGQETLSFMKDSGWMAKADAEGFCLFVLEPAQGTNWGSLDDEMAYITAGVNAEKAGKWLQPGPSLYLVGYGEIGSDLQKYAMENPLNIAGAVFLDASNIDADYIKTNGDVSFNTDTKTYDVTRKEVPVPVKIVGSAADAQNAINYWKAAAADQNALSRFAPEGQAILDAAVQTEEKTYDYAASATTDMIYSFLGQFYRYGGGVLSNAISWKVDYAEKGVEVKSFTDSQGIDRQYLVYIPAAYRNSSEKLPVVIAYHGASTSMRNFFENTLWYNIADQEGIMLVFPESTLVPVPSTLGGGEANPTAYRALWQVEDPDLRYTDVVYANDLLDQLEANYAQVDTGRIYCTGHSMGCMMTHYLGSTSVADRFAAMGATSGPLMAKETENTVSQTVPMFMTMAQYDMWSGDLQQDGTMVTNAVDMWLINNGLATADNVAEVRKTGASETYVDGRFNNSLWKNADGVTLFRYALVTGKDHVNLPAENQLLWNEWFSQITLNPETGVRTFNGQEIK
jgi:poly(3-hydroxybutyrate) depolymerase